MVIVITRLNRASDRTITITSGARVRDISLTLRQRGTPSDAYQARREELALRRHPNAGDRAAVIYSLVISCQRHGHNPHDYLRDVLSRLPAMTTADDLRPLLSAQ